MIDIRKFTIGPQQIGFDFNRSHEQKSTKILAFIDSMIAQKDQVTVYEVIEHFSIKNDKLSKPPHIINCLIDLFKNNKIHFIIDGKKILPDNIKTFLSGHFQSGSDFIRKQTIFSTFKTWFSNPAKWKHIEIIKPETVEKSVLIEAQLLGEKLFKDACLLKQNSLCKYLRKNLRAWESELKRYWKIAETGKYPGAGKIQQGLDNIKKLLNVYDPYEFLNAFNMNGDRLGKAYDELAILKNFFNNQIHVWDKLIEFIKEFTPNLTLLEKDPDVKKALKSLYKISNDPEPYNLIDKIEENISVVKQANDLIVEELVAFAKSDALNEIDKMIEKIRNVLDNKDAGSNTRNNALYPLQDTKRKINMALNLQNISDYLNDAEDLFESTMDMLQ